MSNSDLLWRCAGQTVLGASHERGKLPNQDAIKWFPNYPDMGAGLPLIMAISDGHGSRKNFRSDQGSALAVEAAIKVLKEFSASGHSTQPVPDRKSEFSNPATITDSAKNRLPQRLINEWRDAVDCHWREHPVLAEEEQEWQQVKQEWERSNKSSRPDPQSGLEEPFLIPYGSTLLAVLITEQFTLYLQLGDGDILCVGSNGQVTYPFDRDPRLMANETTSLCTPNAWHDIRVEIQFHAGKLQNQIPALILLATDGYSNSFSSEADFQKIGSDYYDMICSTGLDKVADALTEYLSETSQEGSGDDITLGIIKRLEKNEWDAPMVKAQQIQEKSEKDIGQMRSQQKKNNSDIRFLKKGLIVISTLMLASLGWCGWLNSQINTLKTEASETSPSRKTTSGSSASDGTPEQLTEGKTRQPKPKTSPEPLSDRENPEN
jgi:serine/threonine protein phosphatase PrpC